MKSSILSFLSIFLLIGCTSAASQTRPEVSSQEKINDIDKLEVADELSSQPAEDIDVASDQASAEDAALAEAATPVEAAAADTAEQSSTGSTVETTSDDDTSETAVSDDTAQTNADESVATADEDDDEEPALGSEISSATKAPVERIASLAKVMGDALSNLKIIPSSRAIADAISGSATNEASDESEIETEAATADEQAPVSSATETRAHATTAEVLQAASQLRGLSGWTIIPFAHFQRGDRHAVVAWPAINSAGRLVDATVVGICLEENGDGELEECGRRWVVRNAATSRAATAEALGGTDYQVMSRSSGVALDDLGPRLASLGTQFSRAVAARNSAGARQAAMSVTRLLPLDRVAYENGVARLLYAAASYNGSLEHVSTVRNGDSATLTFHVRRGILRLQTITATASPVNGNTDRWIITSYR